ncbi:uncharacterized protein EKO05_0003653 [Ascochyta rabiei]|uniref:Uncharacterized protein n=1 Tax=Didymella rabiei TaxID=5454 RepID=A0A162YWC1_DIDRA|nr:uncharacterized protein EKO05_0003653 [Ascochyta rabiei]KZM20262.1 hypothetical protein ST47_g8614 [Ascochyta rabiei]UPX13127.1 hypothetical protein EKO05_0003653 [Ascochyta rabiei]
MARKICNHPVFPSLRAKLTALKITVCPTCLIRSHIFEIAETQAALERRGGIFLSRATAEHETVGRGLEMVCHKALVRRWRLEKIDLYRDLCHLEALRTEGAGKTRWELQLVKAFDLWRDVEVECSRMPGYKYSKDDFSDVVDGEEPGVEPEQPNYRLNEVTLDRETAEADEGWETVKNKSTLSRQIPTGVVLLEHLQTITGGDIGMSETKGFDTNLDMQDSDEVALQEMEKVTSRLEPGSNWNSCDRYDLLEEIGDAQDTIFHSIVDDDTSYLVSKWEGRSAEVATAVAHNVLSKAPMQPILKRASFLRLNSKSPSRNKVHISHLATVFCDPGGLRSNCDGVVCPHFSYTNSNSARRRLRFWRKSSTYETKTWAAPQHYRNINTSHYRDAWDDYKVWQRLCDGYDHKWGEDQASECAPNLAGANNNLDGASCAAKTSEGQERDEEGSTEGRYEGMASKISSGGLAKCLY